MSVIPNLRKQGGPRQAKKEVLTPGSGKRVKSRKGHTLVSSLGYMGGRKTSCRRNGVTQNGCSPIPTTLFNRVYFQRGCPGGRGEQQRAPFQLEETHFKTDIMGRGVWRT